MLNVQSILEDPRITPEPNTGCWLWIGSHDRRPGKEYGLAWNGAKVTVAHKMVYEKLIGPVPPGLQLDHRCRVRACVNPNHLEPVTCQENIRRGRRAESERTHCDNGHEFTPANTIWRRSHTRLNKYRECRACKKAWRNK